MKLGGGTFNPWAAFFNGPNVKGFGASGFRWRMFDRGDLKYVILRLLRDRPMHGYELITEVDRIPAVVDEMRSAGTIAVDTETTSTDPMRAELVGVSLSSTEGAAYYLAFGHVPSAVATDSDGNPVLMLDAVEPVPNLPPITSPAMAALRELLADDAVRKVGHNIKYDMHVLERAGAPLGGVHFDTSLASYVLDPGKRQHGLDILALDAKGTRQRGDRHPGSRRDPRGSRGVRSASRRSAGPPLPPPRWVRRR